MLESRFKNRVMVGMCSALTFIYFYNNPDNLDAIKIRIQSGLNSSYNLISRIFNVNLYSNRLIVSSTTFQNENQNKNDNENQKE